MLDMLLIFFVIKIINVFNTKILSFLFNRYWELNLKFNKILLKFKNVAILVPITKLTQNSRNCAHHKTKGKY